jgi:hypothetical protein
MIAGFHVPSINPLAASIIFCILFALSQTSESS